MDSLRWATFSSAWSGKLVSSPFSFRLQCVSFKWTSIPVRRLWSIGIAGALLPMLSRLLSIMRVSKLEKNSRVEKKDTSYVHLGIARMKQHTTSNQTTWRSKRPVMSVNFLLKGKFIFPNTIVTIYLNACIIVQFRHFRLLHIQFDTFRSLI